MNKKKLEMHGNVHIFQMISMRDKDSGKYLPLMDGNVNTMLHRIHANLQNVSSVVMTFPDKDLCDTLQYEQFEKNLISMFDGKVKLKTSTFYGDSVVATRKSLMYKDFDETYIEKNVNLIVSEFPIRFIRNAANIESIYVYNWCAIDETNELLNESFKLESIGAKYHQTFLYSDIQYKYWESKNALTENVYRSIEIFDVELFEKIANTYQDSAISRNSVEHQAIKLFKSIISTIVFFPMRIDDSRYDFDKVLKFCEASHFVLVVTNPTNVKLPETNKCTLIDMSNVADKRLTYFHILKSLRSCDMIIHHEDDMHISLLEHLTISKASITHHIEDTEEYIYRNAK